ncbi:transglutaminase domain-containing protein [Blautia schinkii]|nr:transglutaminase domain-containing protein [Blautia schinkii]
MGEEIFLKESCGRIEKRYRELCEELPEVFHEINDKIEEYCGGSDIQSGNDISVKCHGGIELQYDGDTALACKYLYGSMPYSDIGNYPFETFLDYAAHGVYLWRSFADVRALPEDIFLNYVLYHRVNEEEIAPCRSLFYEKVKDRIEGLHGREAALEVNYWCVEEATYHCTDDRTLSALTVYRRGNGRCGEESTFSVNAMRSAGIPARQVYAPKWSHCDDNHAWVEIWDNGVWYFTGACEPVPILNKGWFTNAASRAMMVHSRWFDTAASDGEVIGREGMVTMLNELPRYALVKQITVQVKKPDGSPAENAHVSFEVLNYAEFAPIAEAETDKDGVVKLTTGLGSLHIWVHWHDATPGMSQDITAESCIDTRNEDLCVIELGTYACGAECKVRATGQTCDASWQELDMIAPVDAPVNTDAPTKEQAETGRKRLDEASRKRKIKTENWSNPERTEFLRGNGNAELRQKLMDVLTEKDQSDCICEVLEEHLEYALPYRDTTDSATTDNAIIDEEIFVQYILNPRVDDEVLRTYRKAVLRAFSAEEQATFRENPVKIWETVEHRIVSCPEGERSSVITTPAGCLRLGIASLLSKKILFVAIARTLGIPARLNPSDRSMEYRKAGAFVPVLPEAEKNCSLVLKDNGIQWKYFQNWSIARLCEGRFVSLKLADAAWDNGVLSLRLEPGRYRIITANRLPNGNTFAYKLDFTLEPGEEKTLELRLRQADLADMLESIAIPEFQLRREDGSFADASELTAEGKHIVMFLEESKEPTEHILNEMMEQEEAFRALAPQIIFVFKTPEGLKDSTVSKAMRCFPGIRVYYDDFTENLNMLGRRMYVDFEKLPLIIVTDGRLNGVYATSGYNVGTGEMLLRLM